MEVCQVMRDRKSLIRGAGCRVPSAGLSFGSDRSQRPAGNAHNSELRIEPLHGIEKSDGTAYEPAIERATELGGRTGANFIDGGRPTDGGKMLDRPHHDPAIFEPVDLESELA